MAKQLKSQNDFFKARAQAASGEIRASDEQNKTMEAYMARTQKEKVFIDIDLLDDAPAEWNFFPGLSPEKMLQLKMSITNSGILTPIIVWERMDGRYTILAGHNRVHASREILEENADIPNLSRDYRKIPAIVYSPTEIDETKAREIIIDTNYIQRGEMSPKLRVPIIVARRELMLMQTDEKGRTIKELADALNIKKASIYQDIQIGTDVIPEIQELYFNEKISRRAVLVFPTYDKPTQKWLYENYLELLTSERILTMGKKRKSREEMAEALAGDTEDRKVYTQATIPQSKLPLFRNVVTMLTADEDFVEICREYWNNHYNLANEGPDAEKNG